MGAKNDKILTSWIGKPTIPENIFSNERVSANKQQIMEQCEHYATTCVKDCVTVVLRCVNL